MAFGDLPTQALTFTTDSTVPDGIVSLYVQCPVCCDLGMVQRPWIDMGTITITRWRRCRRCNSVTRQT